MKEEMNREERQSENADNNVAKEKKHPSPTISKFIIILAGIVFILLVIVNNSVTVDRLLGEISSLDSAHKKIKFRNDSLQAEVKRLSSAERVTRIASEKLGLVYSSQTLDEITIDRSKLDKAEQKDARDTSR